MSINTESATGTASAPTTSTKIAESSTLVAGFYEVQLLFAKSGTDDTKPLNAALYGGTSEIARFLTPYAVGLHRTLRVQLATAATLNVKPLTNAGASAVYSVELVIRGPLPSTRSPM